MSLPRYLFGLFALGLLGFSLAGCKSHLAPVADGYEKVAHPTSPFSFEPGSPRVSFQFREASGKTVLIWPDIYGGDCVVKGGLAVFLGDKAYVDADGKATHPRLFAVKAPELPMDITDEVLWRWSKSNGRDFSKAMNRFSLVTAEEKNGRLGLHLEFVPGGMLSDDRDWPDAGDLQLAWSQVADILRAEKGIGVVEKDLRWHTPYIGMKFSP
jgi:hypothetical protein